MSKDAFNNIRYGNILSAYIAFDPSDVESQAAQTYHMIFNWNNAILSELIAYEELGFAVVDFMLQD